MASQGCSINKAINQPPPIDFSPVKIGANRAEVISVLGTPKHSEMTNGEKTDVFEFIDGYPGASKLRVILYAAADVVTLSLAELILWPLESAALDGKPGRAVVTYDEQNVVKSVKISDREGNPWQ
jgi:hypothetical protein